MTKMREAVEQLRARKRESLAMGGPEKIERQHQRGKLTVRERIDLLFDPGTFQEYGLLASHMMHKPGDKPTPADAVVTGFGRIEGRTAGVLAEDFTVLGGSTGAINMCKRLRIMRLATQERVPLVYLLDGGGARAQMLGQFAEGLPIVTQFLKMARLSGIAPQVAVVMGACAGEPALEASLIEFIIMVRGTGMLAAGGPPVGFPVGGVAHLVDAVVVGPLACQAVGAAGVAVNQQAQGVIPVQAAEGLLQQGMVVKIAATADKNTHYTVHNVSVAGSISIGPGDCTFVIVVLQARDG
jgi:acetyl-CoA carboxylase carboxyltransferase component